jgi:hypothetical protein
MLPLDERQRKARNILFSALAALIVIWTFRLTVPQQTTLSLYQDLSTPNPTSSAASMPTQEAGAHGSQKSKPQENPLLASGITSFNTSKAAVIIETRFRANLIPLILHFTAVLGPTWPIIVYTSAESVGLFSASAALGRYLHSGLIQIRVLPQTVLFTSAASVNAFMTKPWLWENLAPAEHILIFQSDSMLCANAARSVEDFFDYDFVGAPIAKHLGAGYNGGLSLRKRGSMLRILEEWDWNETKQDGDPSEDQWYFRRYTIPNLPSPISCCLLTYWCNRLTDLQENESKDGIEPEDAGAINLPSMEIARTFAVETIDYPHPLGVHQVHRWLKTQMLSLDDWCPEYKLCSVDYHANQPLPENFGK